jgi:anaerobic ribonucleoside-triphosphate reductase activating protein
MISCVLFMGGEWHEEELIHKLKLAQELGYKTALYTGEDDVSVSLKRYLTYLKTGRFIPQLGGLTSPTTNQRLINVSTGECLNHLFH